MTNPKLALIPSGYKGGSGVGTVYSILPNDATGDFDYERNGNASRVRKDGLIEELTVDDTPRLDWLNSNCPSLLLEPQRVNRQFYSEQIDNAVWTKVSTTVTADQTIAPSGEYTADKIQRTSTAANYVIDSASKSASAELDITTSMFVKKGEGDFFAIRQQGSYPNRGEVKYQFSTNTITTSVAGSDFTVVGSSVEDYGNGWVRISATFNTDASSTVSTLFSPRATDGTVDASDTSDSAYAYVWGVQVEEGYPTSYIKTENGFSTRFADECNNAGNADLFNDAEGVLYAEIRALSDDGTNRILGISNGGDFNNSVLLRFSSASNRIQAQIRLGGVYQCSLNYDVTDATEFNKIAFKYKQNDFSLFVNGIERATDTSGNVITGLDVLDFDISTTNEFYGNVKDLRYFDRALTDAELTELTTL